MSEIYMWSSCGEIYYGHSPTEKGAVLEAICEDDIPEGYEIMVSIIERVKIPAFSDFMPLYNIAESANEFLADNVGCIEDDLIELSDSHSFKLIEKLNQAWTEFFNENPLAMREFYLAKVPKKITITKELIQEAKS